MGDVPAIWSATPNGQRAIEEMILPLIGWRDPDRYDVDVALVGTRLSVTITALGEDAPDRFSARLETGAGLDGISLRSTDVPGEFVGSAEISLGEEPQRAILILSASDTDEELIPMYLPSQSNSAESVRGLQNAEAASVGINQAFLDSLRLATGGVELQSDRPPTPDAASLHRDPQPIWPAVAAIAMVLFGASLFAGGIRR